MNRLRKAPVKRNKRDREIAERMDKVYLEHTKISLWAHKKDQCAGDRCTIHNLSNHSMRSFPQWWRGDRGIMERTCPHGVGHPDPDDYNVRMHAYEGVHGCDGCCMEVNTINPEFEAGR